jgi:hypothetical protein
VLAVNAALDVVLDGKDEATGHMRRSLHDWE